MFLGVAGGSASNSMDAKCKRELAPRRSIDVSDIIIVTKLKVVHFLEVHKLVMNDYMYNIH